MTDREVVDNQARDYLEVDDDCFACSWCKYSCPVGGCITFETGIATINPQTCIECGRCVFVCPINAIAQQRALKPRPHYERSRRSL